MPELPEVEITRQSLQGQVCDQPQLTKIEFFRGDLRSKIPKTHAQKAVGQKLIGLFRRAKYLIFEFEKMSFVTHLGMTGTWRFSQLELKAHDHIRLTFSNGVVMVYNDPRRFGFFDVTRSGEVWLKHKKLQELGPEPLQAEFDADVLGQSLKKRAAPIKAVIMDQKVVVGVGNIYASEALFRARIRPTRKASSLKRAEIEALVVQIKSTLEDSLKVGGSSISDFHDGEGQSGYFQTRFAVYDRKSEPCQICGEKIKSKFIGGRNTYWCPHCQS